MKRLEITEKRCRVVFWLLRCSGWEGRNGKEREGACSMSLGMSHVWVGIEVGSCTMLRDGARETIFCRLRPRGHGEIMWVGRG